MTHQHFETTVGELFIRDDFFDLRIRGGLKTEVVFGYNRFTGEATALHFIWKLMIYSEADLVINLRVEDVFRLHQPETATRQQLVRMAFDSLDRFRELSAREFAARGIDIAIPDYEVEQGVYERMLAELKKHAQ